MSEVTSFIVLKSLYIYDIYRGYFSSPQLNREQPDGAAAAAVTAEEGTSTAEPSTTDKYNHGPHDMLLKMPGISNKNAW